MTNDFFRNNIHIETTGDRILVSMGQFDSKIVGNWLSVGEAEVLIKRLKKAIKTVSKGDSSCDCGVCV